MYLFSSKPLFSSEAAQFVRTHISKISSEMDWEKDLLGRVEMVGMGEESLPFLSFYTLRGFF